MARVTVSELAGMLEKLQAQVSEISQRMDALESRDAGGRGAVPAAPLAAPQAPAEPVEAGITEEEMIAISAAIAAFLGVRAHIRRVRKLNNSAWAQQGRVSIQASHRLG